MPQKDSAEKAVRDIRRKTRRKFSAEEKIRIVLEGLRGEESIASLCRREGIAANLYYRWSKEFLEAGKKCLLGDTQREATSTEVTDLRKDHDCRFLGKCALSAYERNSSYWRRYRESGYERKEFRDNILLSALRYAFASRMTRRPYPWQST